MLERMESLLKGIKLIHNAIVFFEVFRIGLFQLLEYVGKFAFMIPEFLTENIDQFPIVIGNQVLKMVNLLLKFNSRNCRSMFVQKFLEEGKFTFP